MGVVGVHTVIGPEPSCQTVSFSGSTSAALLTSQLVTVMTAMPENSACSCSAAMLCTAARPERLASTMWQTGQRSAHQPATIKPRVPRPPAQAGTRVDQARYWFSTLQLML